MVRQINPAVHIDADVSVLVSLHRFVAGMLVAPARPPSLAGLTKIDCATSLCAFLGLEAPPAIAATATAPAPATEAPAAERPAA
jgi:hypothetical protein